MGRSVLIVDDEPIICQGVAAMLEWNKLGFDEVILSYSYEDALRKALSRHFSLILTDIILNDENGLEIVRRAKEMGYCHRFILISAYAEFSFAHSAIEYGVSGYILKPIDRKKLEASILEAMKPEEDYQEDLLPSTENCRENIDIDKIIQYVRRHFREPLTLSGLSGEFFVNPSYLGQKFRKVTGMKFSDYLNLYRVNHACHLLMEGNYQITEICELTGFENITYFYRVFRKITGVKTSEFRRKKASGEVDYPMKSI